MNADAVATVVRAVADRVARSFALRPSGPSVTDVAVAGLDESALVGEDHDLVAVA
jgi:phosphosulfolactate phosphohydrolase-like enzyme